MVNHQIKHPIIIHMNRSNVVKGVIVLLGSCAKSETLHCLHASAANNSTQRSHPYSGVPEKAKGHGPVLASPREQMFDVAA